MQKQATESELFDKVQEYVKTMDQVRLSVFIITSGKAQMILRNPCLLWRIILPSSLL